MRAVETRKEEIRIFWKGNLVRWSQESLRDVKAPEASKRFLAEVGLPVGQDWTFQFAAPDGAPRRLGRARQLVVIGQDYRTPICLDESQDGCVVAVDEEEVHHGFINSSVEQFGQCLMAYQDYRLRVGGLSDEETSRLIGTTDVWMRRSDARAFEDDNHFWPVILEQMRDGLL